MARLRDWGLRVLLVGTLGACAARQERLYPDSAELGLVLLARQPQLPLEQELSRLFDTSLAELGALPASVRGWLSPLGPALQRLKAHSLALASRDPAAFQQALAPYRPLAAYPIALERIKPPADLELAPLVERANAQLATAWRAHGALWLAERLTPQLNLPLPLSQGAPPRQLSLGVAAVSQLHLLLQAAAQGRPPEPSAADLDGQLLDSLRQTQARRALLRARLAAGSEQPRIVQDDLALLLALEQSLLRARTRLAETRQRLDSRLIEAGDRIQAIAQILD